MLSEKSAKPARDNACKIKSKTGLWLFLVYSIVYFGFILTTVLAPDIMGMDVGQLNLAIVYGLGLIVFAVILALVYSAVCTKHEKRMNGNESEDAK